MSESELYGLAAKLFDEHSRWQDVGDADATGWGGQDVFDVYSKSSGTALDGTKYSDW